MKTSPWATKIDTSVPQAPFEGAELERMRDRYGFPTRYITDGTLNIEAIERTYPNEAARKNARETVEKILAEIARLNGTDARTLLLAYDLYWAAGTLIEKLGPHLADLLPVIAKEIVEGGK